MSQRRAVAKTYKLYVGGAFVRSESGRTDPIEGVNVPRGSRKDVRDAVKAARAGFGGWAKKTAYNRGQVLYRFAEALESRSAELSGGTDEIDQAVDLLVHYAGWTDKLAVVMGGINPVAGPHLSFSTPEPTGVVAVLAPDSPDVLGVIREVAPVLAAGNSAVVLVSRTSPLRALDLGEIAGVSDVPGGVLNLLAGRMEELLTPLCGHRDVNAIVDATGDASLALQIDELAAETVKRVSRPAPDADPLSRLEAVMELKTAWHPVGT
ncbi:aldehyde dehydrogenase family protein [Solirubrobacter soli]|uniref:aldehyde dehydrogenase family protein n=1 Tax=Solirubrobacter soli TaxID=363832 RepID=UPI0003FCA580|nr:aldehyde dehydrogenase family protein [Solirubrobacter soli]